jgi:sugar lactone lactonase YvrE
VTRRHLSALAVAAICAGCGSGAGLHIEDGGRTVTLGQVTNPTAPPPTGVTTPPQPGLHLGAPTAIAYADGALWCAVHPGSGVLVGSLVKVSTGSGAPEGAAVPLPPAGQSYLLTVGADGVWLAAGTRLWKIDPDTGAAELTVPLGGRTTAVLDAGGSVWATVTTPRGGRLVRVSPGSGTIVSQTLVGPAPTALTVANGLAWVTDSVDQSILRFAIGRRGVHRNGLIALPRSAVRAPTQITVTAGRVWVYERGRVLRIDPGTDRVIGTTRLAPAAGGTIAAGTSGVWVITRTRVHHLGAVRLLDPASGLPVGRRIVVGGDPTAIVTDGSTAWVFDSATNRLIRIHAG